MPGVIRKETPTSRAAFSFTDLETQAARIVRDAQVQAARILADAKREAEALALRQTREAAERGLAEARRLALEQIRREAFDATLAESRQHLSDLSASLAGCLDRFERAKSGLLAAAERRVIELALVIAQRVCKTIVERDPASVVANARALLEMAQHEHDLKLQLSVADHALLQQVLPELLDAAGRKQHIEIVADPSLARGDSRLVSATGTIDAAISTQLDRVAAALCDGAPAALVTPSSGTTAAASQDSAHALNLPRSQSSEPEPGDGA